MPTPRVYRIVAVTVILLAAPPRQPAARAADAETVVRHIDSRLELLTDDWLVDRLADARFRLHSPTERECVFRFDRPWEGGLSAYVTLLRDGERLRMYYRGGGDLVREHTCIAESDEGIHWTRPVLGLFEFEGSKDNNIIWTGERKAYDESHNFSPFIDANPVAAPEQRYKAVTLARRDSNGKRKNVLVGFISHDGIHWKRLRDEPLITAGAFDSHNVVFWDAVAEHYVCYLRQGREGKKSISRCTSPDFIHWSDPTPLDFGDTPLEHFYTNGIVPYFRAPHIYLGFPMRFVHPTDRNTIGLPPRKTDGFSDAVFMSSHDGLHWSRTFMEAFIRPGLDPARWGGAHGNNTPAWGIVQTDANEISIYWGVNYSNYPEKNRIPELRRGTLRLDGFVSVNAPYTGGECVTRPLVFTGHQLIINYSTSAVGSVQVELQDADGKPIPGFELNNALTIWGDEIERVVTWKNGPDVTMLAGRPVRLRFVMHDADLYSIRFKE